jgi:hypothetical protein
MGNDDAFFRTGTANLKERQVVVLDGLFDQGKAAGAAH